MIIDDEWDNVLGQVFYAKGYIRGFPGAPVSALYCRKQRTQRPVFKNVVLQARLLREKKVIHENHMF